MDGQMMNEWMVGWMMDVSVVQVCANVHAWLRARPWLLLGLDCSDAPVAPADLTSLHWSVWVWHEGGWGGLGVRGQRRSGSSSI